MKIVKITEEYLEFDNNYKLGYYHEQDCCEHVYADFENMQIMNPFINKPMSVSELEFEENLFNNLKGIEGVGFELMSKEGIRVLISCYNRQNGYYSSNLSLILYKFSEILGKLDITNFVEDDII